MYHKLNNKLSSQTGASITISLLLFLICAVVGSVVLAAGTTAGGRFSKLSEMDQRYYSVSSAAELLGQELDGQKVTIVRTSTNTKTETTQYTIDTSQGVNTVTAGSPTITNKYNFSTIAFENSDKNNTSFSKVNETEDEKFMGVSVLPDSETEESFSFLTACALNLLFGGNLCNTVAAMDYVVEHEQGKTDFTLTHDTGKDYLKIKGIYEIRSDGTLIFTMQNDNGSDPYIMRLTMNAAVKESEETSSDSETVDSDSGSGFTETVTTTTTSIKTTEITWTYGGIEKAYSETEAEADG